MESRQLEAFAAVISTGSITAAAQLLARSQPAVTRLVQELEAEIGYALFSRNGPRITPTEQGFLLYDDVERALGSLRKIRERAAEIARGDARPLLMAAISSLAVGLLPQALRQVENRLGPMPIQLRTALPEQVAHAVLSGAVQLGACSLPLAHNGLQVHWIGELACVAALPAGDPLLAHDVVPLAALAQRRIISMNSTSHLRHRVDSVLAQAGQTVGPGRTLIETNASVNAQALVRAGLGVAVLEPLTALGTPLDGVVVRPIDVHIPFFFGVITPQSRPLSAAVQAVIEALLQAAAVLPGFVQHDAADHAALLQTVYGDETSATKVSRKASR
ncbi:LysR family transcriptional regulator [Rhodoferax sp.]|uniref:LysR family transcriptional regulator n=1 Tax=Rhodoferax sp. TaxID=50421 RepID=UPI00374DF1E4